MARKIKKEKNENLLILGEKQEAIKQAEKRKKNLIFPIILMILGIVLMLIGVYFNDIKYFLNISSSNNKEKTPPIKDDNTLKCEMKEEDNTLGLQIKTNYTYVFKDNKLLTLKEKRTITPIEYSDIGPNNIRVINGQYNDLIEKIININGLQIDSSLNNNKLTININIDLEQVDITKIPQNDKIEVINTFNETSKSVKQKLAKKGDILCK